MKVTKMGKVYFTRENSSGCKGPAVVLGRDGQLILMGQTGRHFCVHPRHLLKVNKGNKQKDKNEINQVIRKKRYSLKWIFKGEYTTLKNIIN